MTAPTSRAATGDQRLARLVDELIGRFQAGERVDLQAFAASHPDCAEQLQEVIPALEFLADLPQIGFDSSPPATETAGQEEPRAGVGYVTGTLGDFRILRQIGRGGMGVVYEAQQISLHRRVALKVLPFAAVLDPRHLQRFKNEAQAAASLDHPNIVHVYSVGCERAVHFYAMQYIEGQTLAEVIAGLRPKADGGRRKGEGATERVEGGMRSQRAALGEHVATGQGSGAARSDRIHAVPTGPDESGHYEQPEQPSDSPPSAFPLPPSGEAETQPLALLSTEGSTRSPEFFRTIAHLGIQAAEALEHAHGMGVVHRDIKPSNLMVESRLPSPSGRGAASSLPSPSGRGAGGEGGGAQAPHLWITDFGLAMTQTDANLTMTGDLLGTLRYMSPEQVQAKHGVLDHRTDIYSLGLTLYELLTLQPAFPGDDRQKLIRQVIEDDPRPPRQLNQSIPRDLETIVLKATAKEPEDRYSTAQELAEDLRRLLEDKPIRARRPSMASRAAKCARRHRAAMGAAAILIVTAAIGFALSTWLIWRENQGTKRAVALAQRNADLARGERARAEENLLHARQAVDDYFTLVSENTVLDAPGLQPLRKDLLEAAVAYYERFVKRQSNDPKIQAELAATHLRLAQVHFQTGSEDRFFPTLAHGVELAEKLIRERPNAIDLHLELAGFWHGGRMNVLKSQPFSDDFEGVRILQEAIDLWERFAQKYPTAIGFRSDLSKFYDVIAPKQCRIGQPDQGLRSQKKCLEIREKIVRTNPGVPEHMAELAYAYLHLADRLEESHPDEAEKFHRQSLNIQRDLPNVPWYQNEMGWSYRCLARFLRQQNRLEEAAEALLQSSAVYEKLAVQFSYATPYRRFADSYQLEAHVYRTRHYAHANDLKRATTELDKAVELAAGKASAGNRIAWLLVAGPEKLRDAEKALPLAQQAVEGQPEDWSYRNTLGVVHYRLGQYDQSVEALQKAISLDKNGGTAWDFLFLAMAQRQLGQKVLAEEHYDKALAWMKEHPQKEKDQADELEMFRKEAEEVLNGNK